MRVRSFVAGLLAAAVVAAATTRADAATITYTLPDIGTFTNYNEANTGQTYSGDGFVGLYDPSVFGSEQFGHLFGVEVSTYSRTVSQTDISALAGSTITNATVSFELLDGSAGPQNLTLTGFAGTGALGYLYNVPGTNYGQVLGPAVGGANSFDVTPLLNGSVLNGDTFFNMHFLGSSEYMWTYTYSGYGANADSAKLRLNVDYTPAPVPEPATLTMLGVGMALAARRRLKKKPTA